MSRRHESTLCSALEHFIQQTIPEYITDTGKMIVAENGISNLLWHMEDTYSQASCTVHGEDFQAYSPTITIRLSDKHVEYQCNCMESFGSPCRHVAALALSALSSIDVSQDTPSETTSIRPEWREISLRQVPNRKPAGIISFLDFSPNPDAYPLNFTAQDKTKQDFPLSGRL